jgi:hypothetical protein
MANLKEILPLLLAGVAGAASPQGADAFQNIYRMSLANKEGERREKSDSARLALSERTADRMDKADERATETQAQVTSMRQMSMEKAERLAKKTKEDDRSFKEYREQTYGSGKFSDEEIVELSALTNRTDFDSRVRDLGAPTLRELIEIQKEAEESGFGAQTSSTGKTSLYSQSKGRAGQEGPTKSELRKEAGDFIDDNSSELDDLRIDYEEADEKIRRLQTKMSQESDPEIREELVDEMKDLAKDRHRNKRDYDTLLRIMRRQTTTLLGSDATDSIFGGVVGLEQAPPQSFDEEGTADEPLIEGMTTEQAAEVEALVASQGLGASGLDSNDEQVARAVAAARSGIR